MVSRGKSGWRLPAPGQVPDPLRAHGAWVYLVVSILAGAATVPADGRPAALLAGTGFIGVLVLASSLTIVGRRAVVPRLAVGLILGLVPPVLALTVGGAGFSFLVVGLVAVPLAIVAGYLAAAQGFQSPGALSFGVAALVVAAPVAASAGGAAHVSAVGLFVLLMPVFSWRTWRLAREIGAGWTLERLKRRGLLESTVALAWAVVAAAVSRTLS